MLLDRKIDLPTEVVGKMEILTTGDTRFGNLKLFGFRVAFAKLKFTRRGGEVSVSTGSITIEKYRSERRPFWNRLLYGDEFDWKQVWSIHADTYFHDLMNTRRQASPSQICDWLVNAGLEDRLLFHDQLLLKVLESPRQKLVDVFEEVAPQILGRPREVMAKSA